MDRSVDGNDRAGANSTVLPLRCGTGRCCGDTESTETEEIYNVYAFVVLGVGHEATDAEVETAYRALVSRFPPDQAPTEFTTIRRAYDQIKTERGRVSARMGYYDPTGEALQKELIPWLQGTPCRRLSVDDLRAISERVFTHAK